MKYLFLILSAIICLNTHGSEINDKLRNRYIFFTRNKDNVIDQIYSYMENYHDTIGEVARQKHGSKYLTYKDYIPGAPEVKYYLTATFFNNKDQQPILCLVSIEMYYKMPPVLKTDEAKYKLLEINNIWMKKYNYPQAIILGPPGYLLFRSLIYITEKDPIPSEMFYNALATSTCCWHTYYKELQKKFKMPEEKIITKLPEEKKAK